MGPTISNMYLLFSLLTLFVLYSAVDARLCRNVPKIDKTLWARYDQEFSNEIYSSWKSFTKGETSPAQFATDYNSMLASFLESKIEFQEESKEYFKHNSPSKDNLENAKKLKNHLRKQAKKKDATNEDRARANQALRNYNYILKLQKLKDEARNRNKRSH